MSDKQNDIGWIMNAVKYEDGTGKIFRIRSTPSQDISEEKLSTCVIIEWPVEGDMPSKDQMEHIRRFEDEISELDTENGDSVLFHIITGGGIREWCYYTTNYEYFIDKFNELLVDSPRYPVDIEFQENTTWSYWNSILEHVNSQEG